MDDPYDKVKHNLAFRKQKTMEYGIGFELPASGCPECTENREKKLN
jgi:hypothetical protein